MLLTAGGQKLPLTGISWWGLGKVSRSAEDAKDGAPTAEFSWLYTKRDGDQVQTQIHTHSHHDVMQPKEALHHAGWTSSLYNCGLNKVA
jgi:hypothetical protein